MRLSVVREGLALLYIPDTREAVRPDSVLEPAWLSVFYNPVMIFNRDLSVLVATTYLKGPKVKLVDPLAGSGVRGIRYSLELNNVEEALINDVNREAFGLIELNIGLNHLKDKALAANRDANALLYSLSRELGEAFDLIDVDPFGSPAPFVDSALAAIRKGGLLTLTATDLAVLGGSKREAARRIYGVQLPPGKRRDYREIALRALLAYLALRAAAHDKAIEVLLSISRVHYAKVYVSVHRGAKEANRVLEERLGCLRLALGGASLELRNEIPDGKDCYGPIWTGPIYSAQVIESLTKELDSRPYLDSAAELREVLNTIASEATLQGNFHYRLDYVCSAAKSNMPTMSDMAKALGDMGYRFSRSHFDGLSFRSDALPEEVLEACRRASRSGATVQRGKD